MNETIEKARIHFEQALRLYRDNWQSLLLTVAVVMVPLATLTALVDLWFDAGATLVDNTAERIQTASSTMPTFDDAVRSAAQDPAAFRGRLEAQNERQLAAAVGGLAGIGAMLAGVLLTLFVVLPLSIIATTLAEGALAVQLEQVLAQGAPLSFQDAWRKVLDNAVPLLLTTLLATVLIALGLVCFLLPGIWLAYRWLLVGPVVVLEGKSGFAALARSSELVRLAKNEFWLVLFAFWVVSFIGSWVAGLLFPAALESFLGQIVSMALFPLPALGLLLLYRSVSGRSDPVAPPPETSGLWAPTS